MDEKYTRNEIIRVFRKFARLGLANERLNPIQVYKKIEMLCISRRSRLDMFAVYDTLRILYLNDENEIIEAIFKVYFDGMAYRLTKQEKGVRVIQLAQQSHCDDRTIYRRLEKARNLYKQVRENEGLIEDTLFN